MRPMKKPVAVCKRPAGDESANAHETSASSASDGESDGEKEKEAVDKKLEEKVSKAQA